MDFSKRSVYYNEFRKADHRLVEKIISLLKIDKSSVIADIGAGTGNYSRELAKKNFEVYAIEPCKEMILRNEYQKIRWINSYAENIALPDNSVDATIVINAIHHFFNVEKSLNEIKRITNGSILIFTFDPNVCKKMWLYDYCPKLTKYLIDNYIELEDLKLLLKKIFNSKIKEYIFEIPYDFCDIFSAAAWRRPELLLNDKARQAMSVFNYLPKFETDDCLLKLQNDIDSGVWKQNTLT